MATTTASGTAKLFAVLIAAATFAGLTGCTGDSGTPEPTTPASSSDEGSSPEDEEESDSGCLIGDWVATSSGLEGWYRAFVPDEGITINSVTGEVLISFSDTDFIYSTRDLTVSMTISEQAATTNITGGVAGTYETSPGGIMSTTVDTSDIDGTATVSGITLSASELGLDLTGAASFAGYECTGGNLILETQSAGTGTAIITLEPVG